MSKRKPLEFCDNSIHKPQGRLPADEKWYDGRTIKEIDQATLDFPNLGVLANELNSRLHDKAFVEKNLYLFGENYEHNTDDDLLKVHGWNPDNYVIETGNLVGYVSTKGFKLNITSRFRDDFLKYLLCYTEGLLEVPDSGSIGKDGLYDWIILFLWKRALQEAYRLGIPKQYIPHYEKIFTVKGNVDVLNYAINKGKEGKTLCHYYQHDYNNPVTQLIAYTFSKIEKKALIKDCIQLRNAFENCVEGKRASLSACLNTRPISNPYYSEYNKVISLSKNILRKRFGDITDSSNIESAFLFDMSMLFEYFIRKVLIARGLKLFPKNDESMTISRGLGKNDDRHLYPDIIIDRGNGKIEVYDVKYKHFDTTYGVKREDLFQLHTYVSYLSNKYTVKRCGIIYPTDKSDTDTENIIQHPKYDNGIPFSIRFFQVPKTEENGGFKKSDFDESVRNFQELFNTKN